MINNKVKSAVRKRLGPGGVVIEVGAHFGEDTKEILRINEPDRIYCFEPDPRNISILDAYVKDMRMRSYQVAMSNRDGWTDLFMGYAEGAGPKAFKKYGFIPKEVYKSRKLHASGATSLKRGHPLVEATMRVPVETVRFDGWARKVGIDEVKFLWIDVQGAEKEVIMGADTDINKVQAIWIEYGEVLYKGAMTRKETRDMLVDRGFVVDKKLSDRGDKGNLLFWRADV